MYMLQSLKEPRPVTQNLKNEKPRVSLRYGVILHFFFLVVATFLGVALGVTSDS